MHDNAMTNDHSAPSTTQLFSLLRRYLQPLRGKLLGLALLLCANIGLQLLAPQILRTFIDVAQAHGPQQLLTNAALAFLGVALLNQAVYAALNYLSVAVGWTATNALRADLAAHCLQLDMSFHTANLPGAMIERIDGDVSTLSNFFSQFVMRIVGSALLLLGILSLIAWEDWRLGLLMTSFTIGTLFVVKMLQGSGVPYVKVWRQEVANTVAFWEERLDGLEDIRANGAQAYTLQQHHRLHYALLRSGRTAIIMGRIVIHTWELLSSVGTAALFAYAAYLLHAGTLTIGTVYLVFHYTQLVAFNLLQITYQLADLQSAAAGLERVNALLQTPTKITSGSQTLPAQTPATVTLEHVSFAYTTGKPILHNISFVLTPNKVLGLLGRTGSGKSTLVRLLCRLYDCDQGVIRFNQVALKQLSLPALRRQIGLVTQDVQLFHATIRDNLTFYNAQIPDETLLQAIQTLGVTAWYASLPDGLDTMVLPGGGNLSAGEAQLLAFTRVFLKDPALVILDEPSARLDPVTEQLLQQAIARLLQNRTGIVIAHRLATVQTVDEIMILEQGMIREHGPYQQLAADPDSHFFALLQNGIHEVLA